jgi:hypothetical protein
MWPRVKRGICNAFTVAMPTAAGFIEANRGWKILPKQLLWVVGCQYFGGVTNWVNPAGSFPGPSPIKLGTTKPHWALVADTIARSGTQPWGTFNPSADRDIFDGVPPHRGRSRMPAGANQLFADGSGHWIKAAELRFLHSCNISARLRYFFRDRQDMPANLFSRAIPTPPISVKPPPTWRPRPSCKRSRPMWRTAPASGSLRTPTPACGPPDFIVHPRPGLQLTMFWPPVEIRELSLMKKKRALRSRAFSQNLLLQKVLESSFAYLVVREQLGIPHQVEYSVAGRGVLCFARALEHRHLQLQTVFSSHFLKVGRRLGQHRALRTPAIRLFSARRPGLAPGHSSW